MDAPIHATVIGVFDSRDQANQAIEALHRAGFEDEQFGFAMRDARPMVGGLVADTEAGIHGGGWTAGAAAGGVISGIAGAAAAFLIPGIGPVLASGILATILGAGAGAAAGGLIGSFRDLGVSADEGTEVQKVLEAGHAVVVIRADGRHDEAESILRANNARLLFERKPTPGVASIKDKPAA